jgi:hypothetical protein
MTGVSGALIGGLMVLGCNSSSTPAPSASTSTSISTAKAPAIATPLAWLEAEGKPANKLLNGDQVAVLKASRASTAIGASTFFDHLTSACSAMLHDAHHARNLPGPPSAQLAAAWRTMAATTATYASDCLTVTRTRSSSSLTTWNNSLQAMDTANGSLNSVVAAIRGGGSGG